jgi:hypothetical protein
MRTDLTLVPLFRRHVFRKYDSTTGAVISAQLWKLANRGNGSGEAHRLAARKTDTVRLDVFAIHQPQCRFFTLAARCSKENTNPFARDGAQLTGQDVACQELFQGGRLFAHVSVACLFALFFGQ